MRFQPQQASSSMPTRHWQTVRFRFAFLIFGCLIGLSMALPEMVHGAVSGPAVVVNDFSPIAEHSSVAHAWRLRGDQERPSIGMAGGLELFGILGGRERNRLRSSSRLSRQDEDQEEPDTRRPWVARLWRSCGSWLLSALVLLVASGGLRAAERNAPAVSLTDSATLADVTPVSNTTATRTRRSMQEGAPNSGAYDAPDVRRPYWESPN